MRVASFCVVGAVSAFSMLGGGCAEDPPPFSVSFKAFPTAAPTEGASICCESEAGGIGWSLTGDRAGPLLVVTQETADSPMAVTLFEVIGIEGQNPVRGARLVERSYDMAFGDGEATDGFEFTADGEPWHVEVQGLPGGCPAD